MPASTAADGSGSGETEGYQDSSQQQEWAHGRYIPERPVVRQRLF
jgi:hypothetical protein